MSPRTDQILAITLRPAAASDSAQLFSWRNDPATREASLSQDPILLEDHVAWLQKTLGSHETRLFVACDTTTGVGVGTVRLDLKGTVGMVSVTVDPNARGAGYATWMVLALEEHAKAAGVRRLTATVRTGNPASLRVFSKAGYSPATQRDERGLVDLEKVLE
jgi:RimJ/RimL family protein N-acetyltransferase